MAHWRNSNFQKLYFIVGKAHTPDEAYRLLVELREDRELPVKTFEAELLRQRAKIKRAEKIIANTTDEETPEALDARAEIVEMEAHKSTTQACYDEAIREMAFIDKMILAIQPFRKYAHLPDHEAFQACQAEQWKKELTWRAENQIAMHGAIDSELLSTIRLHPQFPELMEFVISGVAAARAQQPLMLSGKNVNTDMERVIQALRGIDPLMLENGGGKDPET